MLQTAEKACGLSYRKAMVFRSRFRSMAHLSPDEAAAKMRHPIPNGPVLKPLLLVDWKRAKPEGLVYPEAIRASLE